MSHRKIAILVAGMHRSGTSALSRVLNLEGCDLPKTLMEPVPDNNDEGFWESRPIWELNRDILWSSDSDWNDWRPFDPGWYASPTAGPFRERAQVLLHREFGDSRLFVVKDPRLCRLLPFWIEALETFGAEPRVVLPIRNPLDVATSLKQRDGIGVSCGHLIWLRHVLEAESGSRNLKRACLRYETLLSEPHAITDRLGRDLDVSWPKRASVHAHAKIERFLSPELHHHQSDDATFLTNPVLSRWLGQCFELFNRWSRGEVCETDIALLDRIRSAFDEATPLFSRYIADCEQSIAERDGRIEGLSEMVAERDGRIEGLSEMVAERDGRIEGLSEMVAERDGRIEGLSEMVAERDGRIEGLSEMVAERDGRIEGLSEMVAERDGRIEGLSEMVAERDGRIEGLSEMVAERDGRIEELNEALDRRGDEIAALYGSNSWRITAPLRSLQRHVIQRPVSKARTIASLTAQWLYYRLPLPWSVKMRIKEELFRSAPLLFRYTDAYRAWEDFAHARKAAERNGRIQGLSEAVAERNWGGESHPRMDSHGSNPRPKPYRPLEVADSRSGSHVAKCTDPIDPESLSVKLIAFYLPQFHPIPENDEWWGQGFTEWTNVGKAAPQFEGHYQPRLPADLGFYDLRIVEVMERQAALARYYGIHGFCYHYYWFEGRRLLEMPIERMLATGKPDFPFCLSWANEPWTRRWDGKEGEILLAQRHHAEDDLEAMRDVIRYFRHPNYIRIDGKPLFLVYRIGLFPDIQSTVRSWRELCREEGVGELYLAMVASFEYERVDTDPAIYGMDAIVEYPPHGSHDLGIGIPGRKLNPNYAGSVRSYTKLVERRLEADIPDHITRFHCVAPDWDNTARRRDSATIFHGASPGAYEKWLRGVMERTCARRTGDERLVFINAWNEWAEGAYLEPDQRYGHAYLQATRSALETVSRRNLIEEINARFKKSNDICVIFHVYYEDLVDDIITEYLDPIAGKIDMFVTVHESVSMATIARIRGKFPNLYMMMLENRGRDIRPFLKIYPLLVERGYETACKIHTKKTEYRNDGDAIRKRLLDALLKTDIEEITREFSRDEKLGMIVPRGSLVDLSKRQRHISNHYWLDKLLRKIGRADLIGSYNFDFSAGSMFWFRVASLKGLMDKELIDPEQFEVEAGQTDGCLQHAIERVMGLLVKESGFNVTATAPIGTASGHHPSSVDGDEEWPDHIPSMADDIDEVRRSGFFDEKYYLEANPDVRSSGVDPLSHYCTQGWHEKRQPSKDFNGISYLSRYPEAASSGINPLLFHLRIGVHKGFQSMPSMDFASMDFGGQFDVGELVHGPDLSHLRRPRNRLIEELQRFGNTAAEDLPGGIREIAERELAEERPTVSVIMPVWNREKFICRAIQSVLAQSYMPHEIIVVDDGSNDSSRDVVRDRFAAEINSGIVRLIEKSHTGVCDTRNAGLKSATGDLIAYLDSDNTWRRDYLLVMAALFSSAREVATAYAAFHLHNLDSGADYIHSVPYDRAELLIKNFIDLNTFMHRRYVYLQNGGFDVDLTRLVDWDFIISVTRRYSPVFVPYVGADYYLGKAELGNITHTVDLGANMKRVLRKHAAERIRHGIVPIKLAYVLWDWPALSQTFVLEELRWLVRNGQDVAVYFRIEPDRAAEPDFEIDAHRVRDATHLAKLLIRDGRTLCHTHFAAPAAHALTWPASKATGIPFTLFAHAVDIFHDHNRNRNRIAEVVRDPRCLKVFVYGDHHRRFLEEQGVPAEKIAFNMQAVDLSEFEKIPPLADFPSPPSEVRRGILIGRFIEKKGIEVLIDAAARLQGTSVAFDVYGYGPLETSCRKKLAELGIENVNIKGPLDGVQAVAAAIGEADFLVVPSIVAADGDREGFPTVILEAMAAGRPVIASAVSAVPDYLRDMAEAILVTPGDPHSLVDGVRRLLAMTPERREAMLSEARNFLRRHAGTERTLRNYVDVWQSRPVDVFMVTYNTAEYENRAETFEIIRRVLRHTTTPFTLTIIDNNSDPDFRRELIELCTGRSNVRLVFLKDNLLCGPASNMAMALGDASFSIYLCSKEAFVGKHGWERYLIDHMRRNPGHAMAGYRTHLPRFTLGREIVGHPDFARFRNQEFAKRNPDWVFTHVQGGVYIIRRSVIGRHGGFSEQTPQNNMDVEFSYFLESQGEELGAIGEVASLTVKTLPTLSAVLDEHTVVAHPLTLETARGLLDTRRNGRRACCNVCNAESASILEDAGTCARCGSTPFGRSVFQRLAHDWRTHRGGHAVLLTMDPALGKALGARMFHVVYHGRDPDSAAEAIASMKGKVDLAVVDTDCFAASAPGSAEGRQVWSSLAAGLAPAGLGVYPGAGPSSGNSPLYGGLGARPTDASEREERDAAAAPRALSRVLGHDWRRIREIPGPELPR